MGTALSKAPGQDEFVDAVETHSEAGGVDDEQLAWELQEVFDKEAAEWLSNEWAAPAASQAPGTNAAAPARGTSSSTQGRQSRWSIKSLRPKARLTPRPAPSAGPSSSLQTAATERASPKTSRTPNAAAAATQADDADCCVVCLDRPKQYGFFHGSTVHRCCCKTCAQKVWRSRAQQCPICRRKIEKVVTAVY